jgi:hypothetical protein
VSAGVGIWKGIALKAARASLREAAVAAPVPLPNAAAPAPISSLVRQIFFPAASVRRTRVLFAAADGGTKVLAVCEQVGQALAEMSGATVGIVEASPPSAAAFNFSVSNVKKKTSAGVAESEWWRSCSSQIAENLWRVPAIVMRNHSYPAGLDGWTAGDLPFDYVLFAGVVSDSETPAFCSLCDGAVLVLAANQTRKESALRAREYLLQCNAELLGAVLDDRTFPVPEAIYRRL